ncbi:MAG: hypothetical protein F4Z28_06065 [Gammaproteobacteria bacterium]|nr:hypothetical protein [Gammaproteobacteria bacterium]
MDAITHDLAYRTLNPWGSDRSVWFSAHAYDSSTYFGASLWESITGIASGRFGSTALRMTQHARACDDAGTTSLTQVSGQIDPHRAFSLLALKGNAMEGVILGAAGLDGTATFLGELRRRYAGRSFTVDDFLAVAEQAEAGLGDVVDEWMRQSDLPGFLASPAEVVRLGDDEAGQPRYQRGGSCTRELGGRDRQDLRRATQPTLADPLLVLEPRGDPTRTGRPGTPIAGRYRRFRWYKA